MLKRHSLLELVGKTDGKVLVEPKGNELVAAGGGPQHFQHSKSPTGIATSLENAIIGIKLLGVEARYDVFHDRVHVTNFDEVAVSENFDGFEEIALLLRRKVLLKWGFDPGKQHMQDALRLECLEHTYDPVREYLDSLKWDQKPRIDEWLVKHCDSPDTPLNRAFSRKWLLAGVRRVRQPGCKFDPMLVLEGRKQGQGKSSLLKILAGGDENFSDAPIIGNTNREQQEAIQGVWVYEIAELEGMSKHDVTSIKLFLSMTHDRARPAYGHKRVDRARRCVFAGTTNEDDYLRDTTGNRRYWPIKVYMKLIDLVAFQRERDQLWAEAAFYEAQGEALTIPPDLWDAASVVQQARVSHDAWEDLIERHLSALPDKRKSGEDMVKDGVYSVVTDKNGEREWHVASSYLLGPDVLAIPIERQSNALTKRLAEVMRTLGWTKPPQTIRVGTKPCRGFTKTIVEKIPQIAPVEQKVAVGVAEPNAEVEVVVKPLAEIMLNAMAKPKPKPQLGLLPLVRLVR